MPGGDRRGGQASSARAAELAKQARGKGVLGAGFAGFSGSRPVTQYHTEEEPSISGQPLDGDIQQFLKHLSKSNPTTKLKALQGLHSKLHDSDVANFVALLPPWIHAYRRLVTDGHRGVRVKAQEVLEIIVSNLKRELAPHLKSVIGPWWIAQHDLHNDARLAAISAFQAAFPEAKRQGAILFCHQELLKYLKENLSLDVKSFGDTKKEDKDELEIRYENMCCASISAFHKLLEIASETDEKESKAAIAIRNEATGMISTKFFFKKHFNSPSPAVRRSAYELVEATCSHAPKELAAQVSAIASNVIGAIGEKNDSCQVAAWSMVLAFIKTFSESCWSSSNLRKVAIPRLCAVLRSQGDSGSVSTTVFMAALPFLNQIPRDLWESKPEMLVKIMESTWTGAKQRKQSEARKAGVDLLKEVLLWGLLSASMLSDKPLDFCDELLSGFVTNLLIPAMLNGPPSDGVLAKECLKGSIDRLSELSKEDLGSNAGGALKMLMAHFKSNTVTKFATPPDTLGTPGATIDSNCVQVTEFLSELAPSRNQWLVAKVSEFMAQPMGEVLAERGIRHDANVELVQAFAKMVKMYGPSVLSLHQGLDGILEKTVASTQQGKLFEQLLDFFLTGGPGVNLKTAFSELMLSSLIGDSDVGCMSKHWGAMVRAIAASIDARTGAYENYADFARLLIAGIMGLDEDTQNQFACEDLDDLARFCSKPECLTTPSCVEILGSLVGHHKTLLSEAVLIDVLRSALAIIQGGNKEGEPAALGAMMALDGVLFDGGVPETDDGLLAWENLVCGVATKAWEGRGEDNAAFAAAQRLWNAGEELTKLRTRVPLQVQNVMFRLQDHVVKSLQKETTRNSSSTDRLALESAEVLSLAQTPSDKLRALDPMLTVSNTAWVRWCKSDGHPIDEQNSGAIEGGAFMVAYITELIALVGFEDVLGGLHHSDGRPWLAVKMLCEGQVGHVDTKTCDGIVDHLVISTLAAASDEGDDSSMMADVLAICLAGALGSIQPNAFLAVLQSVLTAIVEHAAEEGAIETIDDFFSDKLGGHSNSIEQEKVLLEILPLVVPALRMAPRDQATQSAELKARSLECLEAAQKLPSLHLDANPSSIHTFELALAHFPVESVMCFGGKDKNVHVSDAEKRALLQLLRHQHQEPNEEKTSKKDHRDARHIFGVLDLVAIAYCHDTLKDFDWQGILQRIKSTVHHSTLLLENSVETLSGAVVEIAKNIAISVDSATMAFNLLSRMTKKGRADGLEMLDTLDSMKESGEVVNDLRACTASTQALVLLLNLEPRRSSRMAQQKWQCEDVVKATIGHAVRSALCGAAMMCLTECCGAEVQQSLLEIMGEVIDYWDSVGELVDGAMTTDKIVPEALGSMDMWAEEMGVDGVRCSLTLALGLHPFNGLRKLGVQMLTSEPAVRQLTPLETSSEEDMAKWREAQGQQHINESVYLVQAGVHPLIAPALVQPDALQNFLLSWALILIHFMDLPPDSVQRGNLKSTLAFPASLVSNLLNKLASILPLPEVTSSKRGKTFAKPVIGKRGGLDVSLREFVGEVGIPSSEQEWEVLSVHIYRSVLAELPACSRMWFADMKDRNLVAAVEAYTLVAESPALIKRELDSVEVSHGHSESFRTRCIPARGEVVATMDVDDGASLELVIRMPKCTPLKPAEVECINRVGVSDGQLRKLLFSISIFLRHCSVVEAVALWKKNLDKEFQGVEPCLICYSVIHPSSRELPKLKCATCNVQFHGACLYRWFRQSSKSQCPHCQSPWSVGGRAN